MVELETESVDEDIISQGDVNNNKNIQKSLKISVAIGLDKRLLISAGDMVLIGSLKETVQKTAEFENSDNLNQGRKSLSVLLV